MTQWPEIFDYDSEVRAFRSGKVAGKPMFEKPANYVEPTPMTTPDRQALIEAQKALLNAHRQIAKVLGRT